ncbi:DUF3011 domain-containing protein [Lysobacter yangpyeongensis]|uniref:DUF3011 domain-containing protein n=1 Tax=Lysobacter yangpyeongensis TaxID=346182 RepID=A0ABW0SNC9_9GAMM
MKALLKSLLAAFCLLALSTPTLAQVSSRAYAPEQLRGLSREDQARVIRLEYREQSGGREIADDQLRFYLDQVNRSNWGFSDIKRDIAQSLAGVGGPGPWPGNGQAIRCESTDNRTRACRTPWSGPSRLSRQLSDTRCEEGRNWQSREGEVTVWNGCRAEFTQGWGDAGQGGTIRCESANNRVANCDTPWRGRSQLVRQLSDTRCREGQNWSSGQGRVNVWAGCRGEFARGGNWSGGGSGYTVTCASENGRYTTCNWPPGHGRPRMVQQLSSQSCIEGRTWGMAGSNRIWVNGGCRARFGD